MARILYGISSGMARRRADSLPFLFPRFESPPSPCDLLRDLLIPAAEELADGNAERGFVSQPGFEGRRAAPGFVAGYLDARRGAEKIAKALLSQMRVAAITAEVVIEWPSVGVCHGSTKNRRLAGSSVESETLMFRGSRLMVDENLESPIRSAANNSRSESNAPLSYVNISIMSSSCVR